MQCSLMASLKARLFLLIDMIGTGLTPQMFPHSSFASRASNQTNMLDQISKCQYKINMVQLINTRIPGGLTLGGHCISSLDIYWLNLLMKY